MMGLTSYRVLAIDMSFRGTGMCSISKSPEGITIEDMACFENPMCDGIGFNSLVKASRELHDNTMNRIQNMLISQHNVIIVEMPCFTQSAKSAMLIGMCWGAIAQLKNAILVEPSALKKWSKSKPKDGKKKVKEKVLERVMLDKNQQSNDNIVDAVGLALLFIDAVAKEKYGH